MRPSPRRCRCRGLTCSPRAVASRLRDMAEPKRAVLEAGAGEDRRRREDDWLASPTRVSAAGGPRSEIDCTAGCARVDRSWRWHRPPFSIRWLTDERRGPPRRQRACTRSPHLPRDPNDAVLAARRHARRGRRGARRRSARATSRPSAIAHTISEAPRWASPAQYTPGTLVAPRASVAMLPRASRVTPSCSASGEVCGAGEAEREDQASAGQLALALALARLIGERGRPRARPARRAARRAGPRRRPRARVVRNAKARSPPSSCELEVRKHERPPRPRVVRRPGRPAARASARSG